MARWKVNLSDVEPSMLLKTLWSFAAQFLESLFLGRVVKRVTLGEFVVVGANRWSFCGCCCYQFQCDVFL